MDDCPLRQYIVAVGSWAVDGTNALAYVQTNIKKYTHKDIDRVRAKYNIPPPYNNIILCDTMLGSSSAMFRITP